jgi:hypothetical protein
MGSNLPVPNTHCEVLYRQTYNTLGSITTVGLTQNNRVGNAQKVANTRLTSSTNLGILAGSVVATVGEGEIGPAVTSSDGTFVNKVVGIAVNDAVGNPFESSSAVASQKVVYAHGTGTVFSTDIYEVVQDDGTTPIVYAYGDILYASQNGLLTNETGGAPIGTVAVGIVLKAPTATDAYMTVQMRI